MINSLFNSTNKNYNLNKILFSQVRHHNNNLNQYKLVNLIFKIMIRMIMIVIVLLNQIISNIMFKIALIINSILKIIILRFQ